MIQNDNIMLTNEGLTLNKEYICKKYGLNVIQ
jgi:hypothetical protein